MLTFLPSLLNPTSAVVKRVRDFVGDVRVQNGEYVFAPHDGVTLNLAESQQITQVLQSMQQTLLPQASVLVGK